MRVVSVLTTHVAGGAEYAAVDMLDALARAGHDVELLTDRPELVQGSQVPATPVDLGPKLRRRTVIRTVLTAPLSSLRLMAALRAAAPFDVLLLHFKKEQLLAAMLPGSPTRTVVWVEWGPLPPPLRRGVPRALYALAARRLRLVLAESEATAASVRAAGVAADRIVVVPNVLDDHGLAFDPVGRSAQRAAWRVSERTPVLGVVSRLDPEKRIDVVVDAVARMREPAVLVLAGTGAARADLQAQAVRLGVDVRFEADVRGRIGTVLSGVDIQVYSPSPSEGAARAITVGQLVGRPVVASAPEGARGLVVPGTGAIADPPHDADALAALLDLYIQDPERRGREGAAAAVAARERVARGGGVAALQSALDAARRRRPASS